MLILVHLQIVWCSDVCVFYCVNCVIILSNLVTQTVILYALSKINPILLNQVFFLIMHIGLFRTWFPRGAVPLAQCRPVGKCWDVFFLLLLQPLLIITLMHRIIAGICRNHNSILLLY